jgi:hypothetical protein
MTKPVFSGTVEECVKHFSQRMMADPQRLFWTKRNAIAAILGIKATTAKDWFTEFALPKGENAVRLRCFLELAGYQVAGQPTHRQLAELAKMIGVRELSLHEASHHLSVKPDQVLEYLLRKGGIAPGRQAKLEELLETHRAGTLERTEKLIVEMQKFGLSAKVVRGSGQPVAEKPTVAVETVRLVEASNGSTKSHQIEISLPPAEVLLLAQLINAAVPLAERLASGEFSAKDRQALRQLTQTGHTNNVFELSNSLNRCCSERARAQLESKE